MCLCLWSWLTCKFFAKLILMSLLSMFWPHDTFLWNNILLSILAQKINRFFNLIFTCSQHFASTNFYSEQRLQLKILFAAFFLSLFSRAKDRSFLITTFFFWNLNLDCFYARIPWQKKDYFCDAWFMCTQILFQNK